MAFSLERKEQSYLYAQMTYLAYRKSKQIKKIPLEVKTFNKASGYKIDLKHYTKTDDFILRLLGGYQNKIERKTEPFCLFLCVFRQLTLDQAG